MRGGRSSTPQLKIGARESYDSAEHVGRSYNYHFSCYRKSVSRPRTARGEGLVRASVAGKFDSVGITFWRWPEFGSICLAPRSLNCLFWNAAPLAEGFVGWFIGTFFFYWWHVLRHKNGFWLVFHHAHHSPSRIEIATSSACIAPHRNTERFNPKRARSCIRCWDVR